MNTGLGVRLCLTLFLVLGLRYTIPIRSNDSVKVLYTIRIDFLSWNSELIKKVSSINADIKVILMSAFEINGDELNELNYQEHLQKPIHMRELVSTINQILKS